MGNVCDKDKNPDVQPASNSTPKYKVIVVGDSGTGKTALIHQYINNEFKRDLHATTAFQNYPKFVNIPGGGENGIPEKMQLDIWDTAGMEEQRALTRNFYSGAHAAIIMYQINNGNTFKSVDEHMDNVEQMCKDGPFKYIIGNKCDLEDDRVVLFEDLQDKMQTYGCQGFETSALMDRRPTIDYLFNTIIKDLAKKTVSNANIQLKNKKK